MEWTFLDTWIVITGALSAMACSLLGNYLVLRRMSMMGDAISHAVLPGLAIAFLITGSRDSLPMLAGAVAIGVLTAFMVQGISKLGNLDKGASMGVVFTTLFALGLILIRQAADHVDLDPGCVLYGAIELTPLDTYELFGFEIPRAALTNAGMLLLNSLFVIIFYKELKISTFDPALATTMGINANVMHYVLMTFVAATTVAAFESVGSILVIAMLIVPAACAHLLTDRLPVMLVLSLMIALLSAVLGHMSAITVPGLFGFRDTSTAGMMGVASGLIFFMVFFFAPRHGLISRLLSQLLLTLKITRDDILGILYRYKELATADSAPLKVIDLRSALKLGYSVNLALWDLKRKGRVLTEGVHLSLSTAGEREGQSLVRSHRLWESYLCNQLVVCAEDVHLPAHKLEHFTDASMQSKLNQETGHKDLDPHQRKIPKAT
ncbi:MAG: metal ABC transporter permease [Deltaproteobacteria bacterium]|nr:metal ABC transporter permease [Deltaproteobacteria bacterium]